jgi:acetoin utilization deacetylase AcuC-like enzyme
MAPGAYLPVDSRPPGSRGRFSVEPVLPTAFVSHHDCARHDTGWGHPEHQGRLPAVVNAVYRDMVALYDHLLQVEATPATEADLLRVHTPGHVRRVREAAKRAEAGGQPLPLEGEVVVSGASWEAALAAAGTVLTGVELVLSGRARNAFCAARPPGRDATADAPGGHSLFNSVAVAARHLRERRGVESVLVVDWGARAPRGTPGIVSALPGARMVAVHARTPAIPLAAALREALESATTGWTPGFVLLSAGMDIVPDPRDAHDLTLAVRDVADRLCEGRLACVLEGGYEPRATGQAVVQQLRALAGLPPA